MAKQRKPKTAYELCEMVCEAIKAHPLSYYQGLWKVTPGTRNMYGTCVMPPELNVPENTCGTAFCRAGWMVAVTDPPEAIRRRSNRFNWSRRARQLLGMPAPNRRIFETDDVDVLFNGFAVDGTPGSKKYVREGIAGLRRFMRKHAKHLKARSLRGV